MPQTCSVCRNAKLNEINIALLGGESLRIIAKQNGTTASALLRHKNKCLTTQVHEAQERGLTQTAGSFDDHITRLTGYLDKLEYLIENAPPRDKITAIREARALVLSLRDWRKSDAENETGDWHKKRPEDMNLYEIWAAVFETIPQDERQALTDHIVRRLKEIAQPNILKQPSQPERQAVDRQAALSGDQTKT